MIRISLTIFFLILSAWEGGNAQTLQKRVAKAVSDNQQIVSVISRGTENLYVIRTNRSFRVERENGDLLINKKYDRSIDLIQSDDETRMAVQVYDSRQGDQYHLEIYSILGPKLFEIETSLYQDDLLPIAAVSNTGELALVRPETSALVLFSNQGDTLFSGIIGDNIVPALEKMAMVRFSSDGRFLGVLSMSRPVTMDSATGRWKTAEPFLSLFSAEGHFLWQKPLRGTLPQMLAISPSGEWLAVSTVELTEQGGQPNYHFYMVSRSGLVEFSDSFAADRVIFSLDEKGMMRYSRNNIQWLDLDHFDILSEWQAAPGDGMICDVGVDWEKKEVVALLGQITSSLKGYRIEQSKLLWGGWMKQHFTIVDLSESLAVPAHLREYKVSGIWLLQTPQTIQTIKILR